MATFPGNRLFSTFPSQAINQMKEKRSVAPLPFKQKDDVLNYGPRFLDLIGFNDYVYVSEMRGWVIGFEIEIDRGTIPSALLEELRVRIIQKGDRPMVASLRLDLHAHQHFSCFTHKDRDGMPRRHFSAWTEPTPTPLKIDREATVEFLFKDTIVLGGRRKDLPTLPSRT